MKLLWKQTTFSSMDGILLCAATHPLRRPFTNSLYVNSQDIIDAPERPAAAVLQRVRRAHEAPRQAHHHAAAPLQVGQHSAISSLPHDQTRAKEYFLSLTEQKTVRRRRWRRRRPGRLRVPRRSITRDLRYVDSNIQSLKNIKYNFLPNTY